MMNLRTMTAVSGKPTSTCSPTRGWMSPSSRRRRATSTTWSASTSSTRTPVLKWRNQRRNKSVRKKWIRKRVISEKPVCYVCSCLNTLHNSILVNDCCYTHGSPGSKFAYILLLFNPPALRTAKCPWRLFCLVRHSSVWHFHVCTHLLTSPGRSPPV